MTVNHGVLGSSPREGAKAEVKTSAFLFLKAMASVYIIFSDSLKKFYIGYTTENVVQRIERHNNKYYENKYTAIGIPWTLFLEIKCDSIEHALKIEKRIKSMKSKIYIQNLKKYPEMVAKLKEKCLL